ncbi:MAG: LuxR C-terminal-related transcriptional regulator [Motiliproteus sp.]
MSHSPKFDTEENQAENDTVIVGRYPLLNSYVSTLLTAHISATRVKEYNSAQQFLSNHQQAVELLVMIVDRHRPIDWAALASATAINTARRRILIVEKGCHVPQDILRTSLVVPMGLKQIELETLVKDLVSNRFSKVIWKTVPDHYLAPCSSAFTSKQRQVLGFLGKGMSNKQIAFNMRLSEKTIKGHMTNIIKKTGCRCRVDAALMANRISL